MKAILTFLLIAGVIAAPQIGSDPWKRHTIDPSDASLGKKGADGVRLADANRDLRPDVVTGWENGNAVRVCLNPGPEKIREEWPAVTVGKVSGAEDAIFTDLDGDVRMDVVSATEGKTRSIFIHWAPKNPSDYLVEEAWTTTTIDCTEKAARWMFLLNFDVNRDGAADLIAGSKGENGAIGWLINPGHASARNGAMWKWKEAAPASWIMSIRSIDLDGDGQREIVYSDRKGDRSGIYAMNHLNVEPWLSEPIFLGFAGEEVMFIDIADLDGDGRKDIAAAIRPHQFGYLIQPPGNPWDGPWEEVMTSPIENRDSLGQSKAVRIGDLTGDGKPDIAATCEHAKGSLCGVFHFPFQTDPDQPIRAVKIADSRGVKFDRIELLDLDEDGDLDLMTCEETDGLGVFWFENPR